MLTFARNCPRIFGVALDAMSEKLLVLDREGRIVFFNQAWRDFVSQQGRRNRTFGLGRTLQSLALIKNGCVHPPELGPCLDRVVAGTDTEFACTLLLDEKKDRWLRLRAAHIAHRKRASAIVTLEDVSDIHSARKAMNDMSLRLTEVQQQERQRIALELHDSTAQHLVGASLNLTGLRKRIALSAAEVGLLEDIDRSLHAALHEVQVTSFLLYPTDLARDGLNATLGRFVRTYARQTGISTQLRASRLDELAVDLQRALLRIVQEALANIYRHAGSPRADVCLRLTPESVVLYVADTGKGMCWTGAPDELAAGTGLGIAGMRARAESFGGELRVKSWPRRGTRVLARIPASSLDGREFACRQKSMAPTAGIF
jgi:two-component system NarL family sensor kinase